MKSLSTLRKIALFVLVQTGILTPVLAGQFTWNGSQSNLWNNTANWTPIGLPGNQDTITINNAAHTVQLDQNRSVHRIIMNNGTINLNSFELLVTQRATFNDGAVNNGTLKLRGTFAYLQGTDFDCSVDVITGQLRLSGGVFQQAASFEQNGSASGWGEGGCVFNATVTVRNSGTAVLRMANTQGDVFNADVNFISSGSGALQPAHNGSSSYNGNITISCTNTGGINFCNGTNGGSATLASGKTLTAGAGGLTAGVITLRNLTQNGSTAQSLSTTGSSTLNIFGCVFNGNATFSAPSLLLRNSTFHQTSTLTKTGNAANHWDGGNSFKGDVTISNTTTGSGILRLAVQNGDTFEGNATFTTSTGFIQGAFSDTTTFMKDISINSSRVTFNNGNGWVEFSGATNQTLSGTASYQISKALLNKGSGILALSRQAQIDSLLNLVSGKIVSDSVNPLTIGNVCSVSQNGNSFVDGPVRKVGSSAFTFPIGNGLRFMPLSISAPSNSNDAFTAQFISGLQPYGLNLDSTLMLPDSC